MPKLDKRTIQEIIANPYETRSDSFYFVDGELVMHHRIGVKSVRQSGQALNWPGLPSTVTRRPKFDLFTNRKTR